MTTTLSNGTRIVYNSIGGGSGAQKPYTLLQSMRDSLPISPDVNAAAYFKSRWDSLFSLNEIRVMEIFEIIQYGSLYLIASFITGFGLDVLFQKYEEEQTTKKLVIEVILQTIAILLTVFYIRKIVKLVPFMSVINFDLNGDGKIPAYRPYETAAANGDIIIVLVFFATQLNYIKKITELSMRFYEYIDTTFKKEKPAAVPVKEQSGGQQQPGQQQHQPGDRLQPVMQQQQPQSFNPLGNGGSIQTQWNVEPYQQW